MARRDEVKVLGSHLSPFTTRVKIALNLKGVRFEFLQEKFGEKSELLLKSNPVYKKIPVLLHDGRPICESMIIVQYIDDVWSFPGDATLSGDPYNRSIARFWTTYIDDKWYPGMREIIMAHTKEAIAEAAEKLSAELPLSEEAFEKCSHGKDFFGGDTIGYLDIALGSYLSWLAAVGRISGVNFLDEEKTPLLVGWAKRFCSTEGVKEALPDVDELVEVAKKIKTAFGGAPPAN